MGLLRCSRSFNRLSVLATRDSRTGHGCLGRQDLDPRANTMRGLEAAKAHLEQWHPLCNCKIDLTRCGLPRPWISMGAQLCRSRTRQIMAWRCSKHSFVFATKLRNALVTHRIGHARRVAPYDRNPAACLMQAYGLLILERRHP